MTQLPFIGCLREDDLDRIPPAMRRSVYILRDIAPCGMPFANADGTLKVYLTIKATDMHGDIGRADIDSNGRILFREDER